MAGKSQYERAKQMLKAFDGQTFVLEGLQYLIKTRLCSEKNRMKSYEELMKSTGLIKEVEGSKFEIVAV